MPHCKIPNTAAFILKLWNFSLISSSAYRKISHANRILEEPLKAGGPAGHALLLKPLVTAIAGQAALAAASLQLDSTVICRKEAKAKG